MWPWSRRTPEPQREPEVHDFTLVPESSFALTSGGMTNIQMPLLVNLPTTPNATGDYEIQYRIMEHQGTSFLCFDIRYESGSTYRIRFGPEALPWLVKVYEAGMFTIKERPSGHQIFNIGDGARKAIAAFGQQNR